MSLLVVKRSSREAGSCMACGHCMPPVDVNVIVAGSWQTRLCNEHLREVAKVAGILGPAPASGVSLGAATRARALLREAMKELTP